LANAVGAGAVGAAVAVADPSPVDAPPSSESETGEAAARAFPAGGPAAAAPAGFTDDVPPGRLSGALPVLGPAAWTLDRAAEAGTGPLAAVAFVPPAVAAAAGGGGGGAAAAAAAAAVLTGALAGGGGAGLPGAGNCPPLVPSLALFVAGLRAGLGVASVSVAAKSLPFVLSAAGSAEAAPPACAGPPTCADPPACAAPLACAALFTCAAALLTGVREIIGIAFILLKQQVTCQALIIPAGRRD
jgi:hypothetical protein